MRCMYAEFVMPSDRTLPSSYKALMSTSLVLGLAGLATLLPAALLPFRAARRDAIFWLLVAIATFGPVAFGAARLHGGWHTGFGASLWFSIAATMLTFVAVALLSRYGWRLGTLLTPYLMGLGILATVWATAPEHAIAGSVPAVWLTLHILVALATYALLTLAAVAGLAVWLKERSIRRRHQDGWADRLPSVADSERLLRRLLGWAEAILGAGIATGMAVQIYATGSLLEPDHKTLLSLAAFVAIGALLVAHRRFGVRGQAAARFVLLAWLLLTLAYPGVKFVTDVLVG
jgi:ABC-type uncharacterized transport system permease subunit